MSIAPRNVWLALVLVALVSLQLVTAPRRADERPIEALFPLLTAGAAREIVLESSDADGAAGTLRLVYEAGLPDLLAADEEAAEGRWVLPAEHGFPARAGVVMALLDHLVGLTSIDLLSSSKAEHAGFGVDDAGLRVHVLGAGGAPLASFVQGALTSAGPGGRGSATYIRPLAAGGGDGAEAVYRARRLNPLTLDAIQWLETRWLAFDPKLVRGVRVSGAEWTPGFELVRDAAGAWSLAAGGAVPARVMNELLNRVFYLFFDGVEGREGLAALDAPALELTLVLESGEATEELTLTFGPARTDGSRASAKPGSPWTVRFEEQTFALVASALRQVEGR